MSNVPHQEYFACDPCECGGHPDCPVCGVEAVVREREAELAKRAEEEKNWPEPDGYRIGDGGRIIPTS
jgi:hypothetical protein